MPRAFVFDAYGTLFDVHAAVARHRAAAGPDADRFSEIWRIKQLEYSWTLTLAGRFLDPHAARARFRLRALSFGRYRASAEIARGVLDAGALFGFAPGFAPAPGARRLHRDPLERLAEHACGRGRRCRDRRRTGCRALRGCNPHLQAASRGLCARHRSLP